MIELWSPLSFCDFISFTTFYNRSNKKKLYFAKISHDFYLFAFLFNLYLFTLYCAMAEVILKRNE